MGSITFYREVASYFRRSHLISENIWISKKKHERGLKWRKSIGLQVASAAPIASINSRTKPIERFIDSEETFSYTNIVYIYKVKVVHLITAINLLRMEKPRFRFLFFFAVIHMNKMARSYNSIIRKCLAIFFPFVRFILLTNIFK